MSVLTRITTRAKQLYKKGKAGISWIAAIKRASAQVKGKTKTVKRKPRRRSRKIGKGPTITPTRTIVLAGLGKVKRRRSRKIGKTIAKGFKVSGTPNYLTFDKIYWRVVKDDKIPFTMKNKSFYTLKGQQIHWEFLESRTAQNWLKKHRIKTKI